MAQRNLTPKHFRSAAWALFFALLALQFVWYLLWVPARLHPGVALSIALLPLLPGLLTRLLQQRFAIVIAGFGVLAHFTFAAMEAVIAGANRAPAIVQCFLCFAFFLCWNFAVLGEKRILRSHNTAQN
jgi:uncharacterized membrane protein